MEKSDVQPHYAARCSGDPRQTAALCHLSSRGRPVRKGFYSIERLDSESPNDGYQRLLNKGRAKKLADYLIGGQEDQDAFLPTSIFLATDKPIRFDESANTISFDISEIGPFSVVDGQHRMS